jgi:hypothetical protein
VATAPCFILRRLNYCINRAYFQSSVMLETVQIVLLSPA